MLDSESTSPALSNLTAEDQSLAMSNPHPSTSRRRTWPLILGLLILAVGAGWGGNWWLNSRNNSNSGPGALAKQPPPASVKLMTLTTGVIENTSEVVGTFEAKEALTLKPEIDGRISEILVKEGDRIQKGQPLLRLDSNDWDAELYQAQAQLASTQARLAELQAGNRREDIDEAKARLQQAQARLGNARGGSSPEEIAQAQAQLSSAIAEAELAQQRVGRYEQLREQGAVSADQYQEYNTQARSATAAVEQAKRRLSQLQKSRGSNIDELAAAAEQESQNVQRMQNGPRLEVIAQAKAAVAEARAKVRIAQVNLSKAQIVAPMSGVIGDIPVKIGDYIEGGDTLTTLTENNVLELNLSIPLEKASELKLGLPVELLDTQGKASGRGTISFISPNVTANSQLILAKATFLNVNRELLNRQFVQAKVIWEKRPGLLIPATAVSRLGGQNFVFVAKSNNSAKGDEPKLIVQQKQVDLGNLQGNNYQVIKGLEAGEKVVTAGILQLKDGAPIQPLK